METRREFLAMAGNGALLASLGALPQHSMAADFTSGTGISNPQIDRERGNTWLDNLPGFGMGGVPLGNEFEVVTDDQAFETLTAAWKAGVRYFDVAPWYGLGLAERRFGSFLHNQKRTDFFISTKVGKLLKASRNNKGATLFPHAGSPNTPVYDYSGPAIRRSVEDSLQRLGIDSIDIAFVHDLSPDFRYFDRSWLEHWEIARKGAFPELNKMREEGLIKAWGLGVNRPEPILKAMQDSTPDVFLMASQYSLIDHQNALHTLFPEIRKHNIKLVIGSSLNAGFLSGSNRYNYDPTKPIPKEYLAKRETLRQVAASHGVDLRTAALQFSSFPDVAAALIVGARTAQQITEDVASMNAKIPADFWSELKAKGLIDKDAQTSKHPS
ncbi:aldo/keto reductase [Spirosoma foliorum]|uniref:Aldo/keto reductase n=1 Tax=Spirosoma foliorum TaxID=2710596 RepID=A0A7G5GVB8_9BACT|nr:aldo/keto reductase [Spirosoma foliorum]QMW02810.1 aldo/keto reductase [Spirosoma foliorum]